MRRTVFCLVAALLLVGCATSAHFQEKMNGFLGQHESVLVGHYGPPQAVYTLSDGSKVVQYTRGSQVAIPGAVYTTPVQTITTGSMRSGRPYQMTQVAGTYTATSTTYVPQQAPATVLSLSCTVNFTLSANGTVTNWASSGNQCVAQ